ncbi:MAG: amino acid adenylation domain-containing protein [Proteobacteria bacterium]|uniref:amino acid adenylation domain-containing protein n=1 Tax=Aquabacterium sp. TaxID=1872578 RepID=UPI0035C70A41|nr:amino acid adenylation domain-containing protein [Pseudomonadota bacterium]
MPASSSPVPAAAWPVRQTLTRTAERLPEAIALEGLGVRWTYRVLAQRVAQRRQAWAAAGLLPGQRLGIAATRSADTVVSILAALEHGLAYVPLDLSYPAERLQAMLRDAQVRAVVGEADALQALQGLVGDVPTLACPAPAGPRPHADNGDLAYVLFTSGSTGRPKGVAMGCTPLDHLIGWHVAHPRLGQAARTLQFAPLSFDVHFQEIVSTLATGGTLVLVADEVRRDPARLHQALAEQQVSRLYLPYVALQMLAQADADAGHGPALVLGDVVSAGEQLQITPDIRALFARQTGAVLHNHYGPTESHVVTAHELSGPPQAWPQIPPIGRPLPHVAVRLRPLRDEDGGEAVASDVASEVAPPPPHANDTNDAGNTRTGSGQSGELLLGGDCLAEGYLGRADLSAERFLTDADANANAQAPGQAGRWYVTGDLVRQGADGVLSYLGRADQQLKVDGFRIEPGDIELALMAHPSLQDAVVTAPRDPDGSRVLTAHVVLRPGIGAVQPPVAEWRQWLRERLPEYMIPVRFAVLARLPTTPSGKIDRRGLPAVSPQAAASGHTDVRTRIRATWQELLGLPQLDDEARLFDLGARSLLVMRFVARMKEAGIRLSVADVYDRPSVAGLTALASADDADAAHTATSAGPQARPVPAGGHPHEGMAIVGMALRVDDASDIDTFWDNLLRGKEAIRRFRPEELDPSVPEALWRQPNFVAARGVLDNADCFDAGFFGISAREARLMDPQQRLFLELCWTALEHAGIDPSRTPERIGVYAGTANNAYLPAMRAEDPALIAQAGEFTAMLANEKDYVATRAAHRLDFHGPAVAIHSACSTSLVAIAHAWHALAQGQCEVALAGGVTVQVPQAGGYLHVEGGMESADGRCRPFDAQASGTVFGSGGGVVVLKRLSQAQADGDTIYGVISGVGLNNDGGDKASFTAPSVAGQAQAIRMALAHAQVNARSIGYVEAHGTGTALGDPIEVAALSRAWSGDTRDTGYCLLGSIKGHVGHLVAAAGVLGLIKATLSLHRECVPGTLHFSQPNPQIDFASTPFHVSAQAQPWPRGQAPRRAAVSSFGVGGTNAHVILEEAPAAAVPAASQDAAVLQLLPLSARHPQALQQRAQDLALHLQRHPEQPLSAVAATLMRGRLAMPLRATVVAANHAEAIAALQSLRPAQGNATVLRAPRLVFLFPGQGSQHPGMARGLCEALPAFREAFEACLDAAPAELAQTLRQLLTQARADDAQAAATLAETRHAQPALFAVSCALAAWLDSLGLRPQAMIGHSIGEYAAACHAGVMSVGDAMRAVIARGQAMFEQPGGAMLAVRTDVGTLQPLLPQGVDIAALNAPQLTVVAGPHAEIEQLAGLLEARDIGVTRLKVSHAFHSAAMDGALPRVEAALAQARLQMPQGPQASQPRLYSCISGAPLRAEEATAPAYWARQVRAPVAFSRAVLAEQAPQGESSGGQPLFIEVGPGQALTALVRQHRATGAPAPAVVPLLMSAQQAAQGSTDPSRHALQALGQLWSLGADIAWPVPARSPRLALPTYPFLREVHWFTRSVPATLMPLTSSATHPLSHATIAQTQPPAMNRLPRIEQEIARILSDVAGLPAESVQRDATFVDQGLDSLSLTQATLAFEQSFGIKLRFRRLLEDLDTLAKLASFFDSQLPADKFAPAAPTTPPTASAATSTLALQPLQAAQGMDAGGILQQMIRQQMQLMSQQLALLSGQNLSLPATQAQAQAQPQTHTPAQALPAATCPSAVIHPAPDTAAAAASAEQPGKNALVEKPFGASARIVLNAHNDVTPAQQQWIDDFIRRYNARTGRSKAFSQQHRKVMADPRVVTGFNPLWKDLVYPIVVDRSEGARVWDIDGNAYIDLLSCFGANFLGYKPADVTQAIAEQLQRGIEVGPQHPMAAEVAQLIADITGMERVAFCNTGSEAVMGAMRIARTVTGRKKIAIFNNSYHGIFDEVIVRGTRQLRSLSAAPGILANAVENILVLDYDSPESLEVLRQCAHELAAIMIEPIQNKYPTLQPRAFVQQLREIATQGGAALIFDEVVTGFRVAPGGAQEFYGVRADIATYGKIIGGGLPFAAIAGGSRWLDALDGGHWQYGDDSYPEAGVTYFAGTFVRHPLALAAARATLRHLKQGGRALYDSVNARTQRMVDRINAAFTARHAPVKAVHCASLWRLQWDDNTRHVSLFYYLARLRGLHLYEQFGHFVTEAMTDADCTLVADTFIGALDELMAQGLIAPREGLAPPAPTAIGANAASALAPGQTERWLAAIYDPAARLALNESFCVTLKGRVDVAALKQALQDVLQRHEAFKLSFELDQPRQILHPDVQVPISEVDLRTWPDGDQALEQHAWQASATDFPLDQAPLARASILTLADGRVVVHVVASHLVFDGWASSVFNAELAQAYQARSQGQAPRWPAAASPLRFAEAEHKRFDSAEGRDSLAYWKQTLQNLPAPVALGDKVPSGPRTFAADTVRGRLDGARLARLKELARAHEATLFQWLLHGVAELIAHDSGQRDFVVSIPYAAQSLERHGPLLADGVLDLPLRLQLTEGEAAEDQVRRIKSALMDAMEHPLMTQGTAARALGLQAEGSRPALTSVYFNLNPKVDLSGWAPLEAAMHEGRKRGLLGEVFFNFYEQADALTLDLHHSTEHLSTQRAQQLVDRLMAHLAPPAEAALDARLLSWNQTDRTLETPARVEAWLSRQADRSPAATAVVTHEGSLSYRQLESQSNRIARLLQDSGVGPGQRVGISLPRGRHLLPALLGVLKTGAAYVPMDPGFPTERLKMMAEDAGLTRIVTHSSCADASGLPQAMQLQLDRDAARLEAFSDAPLPLHGDAQAPAYVIYTSGSTGRPKGVAVPHRAVCNFLASMLREPGLQASDRLLAVTTLSFDIAVLELLLPLCAGGTVVLATRDQAMDGEALMALAAQQGATVMQATPTTWHLLLDAGWQAPKGFRALVGGEPLPAALAGALLAKGCDVWNMYGPTETTVWSTLSHVTDPAARICIGRPIDNTQVWILDEALQALPVGAEGEICIGGDGVALGYHGREDLTAERFVTLPWGPRAGQRVYRTGDLGRWREDGQIEHLGRMDFQVKIRGYRIELGEIEAQLEKQAGVSRAVVVACDITPGDMALIGYVVPSAGAALDTAALRTALRQTLPDYMVPRTVLALPSLPLLPNNKVDRKALPLPAASVAAPAVAVAAQAAPPAAAATAASGPAAQAIDTVAREMGQLLGRERLGETEHFFEQGGHSLMAAKLSALLAKALGQRPGLRLIFDNPTPRQLGQALWQMNAQQARSAAPSPSAADTIPIRADQSTAPLSQMQERVWFLENLTPGTVVHSIPTGHRLLGPLDVDAFNRAWQLLIQRQSVLRTVIERGPQGDVQRVLPELPFSLIPFDDFSHLPPDDRKAAMNKVIAELVETPYELEQGPLFTARLFRLSAEEHGLLFQAHHLIWDAWSFDLLYVDLPELYSACLENRPPRLPPLTVSYGDFAAWHNEWMTGPELQRQLGYWREQLTPLPPPLAFPIDHPRPAVMSGRGGSFQFNLAKDVTDALRAQAQQHGRTLYITLLAAYALALHRVSHQDDFVIGTPVRGREQPALEHLMGFFVNMLPLRMRPRPDMALDDWLRAVHRMVVDAFSYPDVPFDHLVHEMQVPRDRSRPPIHQVSFSYQDVRERTTRWGNVDHQRMPTPMLGAAQDLALWCVETRNHIEFVFTFNADVLETSSVAHFARSLEQLLRDFVTDPDRPLSGYDFSPGSLPAPAAAAPASASPPASASAPTAAAPAAASASLEDTIAEVWRGLLGLPQFGLDDNFFDRGGHSLLVMRAVTQIRTRTGKSVSVHAIFDNPTPRQLAQALGGQAETAPARPASTALVVPHRAEQDTAPLSQMQQRVWYLENLTPHSVAHHIPSAHRLVGPLNAEALSQAWQQLVARQSALRTVIERTPSGDRQRILPRLETALLPLEDLSALPADAREATLRTRLNALSHTPFDLEHGPLFAIRLFKLADQDHVLFLLVHHLVWDGWSFQILNDELSELYAAALAGRPAALPPLPVSHGDFAAWHNQWMSGEALQRQTAFWQGQLSPLPAPLALPLDHARPAVMSGEGASLVFRLDPQTTRMLRAAAQSEGRTLFTTLLGAFGLLLHKLTGQDDLVIGTPVRGRDHPELESLIGFFVNTLPVRLRPRDDLTVGEWFAHVQRHVIEALSHPDVPLDHLVRTLRPPRDTSRSTLYQALFSYQDARERSSTWGNVQHLRHDLPMVGAAQDLALWCVETPDDIEFTFSYDTAILGQPTVQLFAERLSDLLQRLASLSETRLLSVSVQCPREVQALKQWNDTASPWPTRASIVDLLRQAAHSQGSDIALSQSGERPLSHAEVWARAHQIAHQLRAQGLGRGDLVGVCMPRCPDLLTSLLGVLLTGAAYVPLDPAYPGERLAYMAEDARLAWVISRADAMQALRWPRDKTLLTDLDDALLQQQPATPLPPAPQADASLNDPAYVIYTSGSTGKPKGVVVPHGAVVNFLRSMARQPGLQAHQRLLAVTTLSFDISVLELFLPLLVGAEIVLCRSEDTRDPFLLKALIEDGIDVMQATPSTWHALIDAGWQGRPGFTALVGGETLSARLASDLMARCDAVWNMYGPTETTVWSTCWRVAQTDGGMRIGRPIANTQVHILDEHGHPCPVGTPGELCIGGEGVSSGYLYRPELTAERFVRDTFQSRPEARLYRTGDLARWCPDGELEHLGRLDHQVKVRGHRIELGEIEAALLAIPAIGQAVVVTREDQPGDVRLVAYGVPRDRQATPALQELKSQLARDLPDHMLPQHIVLLDALPRLPNGKVDRGALPRPSEAAASSPPASQAARRSPVTPEEKAMAEVWQELLDTQDVGLDDNFFNLGGHSLLAMRAVTEIKRRTGLTLHVRRLIFETLGQLAAAPAAQAAEAPSPDVPTRTPQPPSRGGWLGRWLGR